MDGRGDRPAVIWLARAGRVLLVAALAAFIWAAWLAFSGGITFTIGDTPISGNIRRPLIQGSWAFAAGLLLAGLPPAFERLRRDARAPQRTAMLLSVATLLIGIVYCTYTAAGPDAYGYVSQAALWRSGKLITPTPLSDVAAWPDAQWALTPLGYRPAVQRGYMVPIYPPGLPMTMALFQAWGGERAGYLFVPVAGALCIWLTWLLGMRLAGHAAGLLAALGLLASPSFLFQLVQPMSDVPATLWWLLAAVCALNSRTLVQLAGGASAAMAVLTRPNLAPLLLPLTVLVVAAAGDTLLARAKRLVCWLLPVIGGGLALAAINRSLYGAPTSFGYTAIDSLFSPDNAAVNVARYGSWLLSTQTGFIALGIAAPLVLWRAGRRREAWLALWMLACAATLFACYLFYQPFDQWPFVRFLLPAFPYLLATAAAAIVVAVRSMPRRDAILVALAVVLLCRGLWEGRMAFTAHVFEGRYRTAAAMTADLPRNAVIIANLHSGSLRYYANRLTLRFEWLPPTAFDTAVRTLADRGPVYAMIDDTEIAEFRDRYVRATDLRWLASPMRRTADGRVALYAIAGN